MSEGGRFFVNRAVAEVERSVAPEGSLRLFEAIALTVRITS